MAYTKSFSSRLPGASGNKNKAAALNPARRPFVLSFVVGFVDREVRCQEFSVQVVPFQAALVTPLLKAMVCA